MSVIIEKTSGAVTRYGMFGEGDVVAVAVSGGPDSVCLFETLYGLSGLGDLALTCYSPKSSHNKNFGRRIGQGEKIADILASMGGTVAEGYYTTKAVWEISKRENIDLPLCRGAYQVIYENMSLKDSMMELMNRPLKVED